MSEQKTKADVTELLLKTADGLTALADSVRALCASLADSPQEEPKPQPAKKKQTIPLEKVRGVLAEKSRDGYTAEVRAIIQSFGAERLSEIDSANYEAVLKKAEVLGNG